MMQHEDLPVRIKGVGDSLWVTVDPALPVQKLKVELEKPFSRLGHLAVNARVIIDTGGHGDPDKLIEDLGGFLKTRFQVGRVSKPQTRKTDSIKHRIRQQDMGNSWHHYRSDVLMVAGRVRSGQKIRANKHLLIMGDLNPGAEAVAGGDILVMGSLMGRASAGQPDNENAIVMALEFRPTQVQIGGFVAAGAPNTGGGGPEFAFIENNTIVVEDYIKKNPFKQLAWPEVR